jgi:putative ABC transport system ATP-binding protein
MNGEMTDAPALALVAVSRAHDDGAHRVVALDSVSLTVHPGELVAVMGPSGSGKSTLLNLAGGLDQPDAGEVIVDGIVLGSLDPRRLAELRRHAMGYVFQDLNLIPSLTAAENVSLPLELDGSSMRIAGEAARAALEKVGIRDLANRFPEELSGGERQRTAIARALVGNRRLVLADEPTGALDSATGDAVLQILRERCDAGASALLVTHEARHAAWADRVIFLRDGRVVDSTGDAGGPESLLRTVG